MRVVKKTIKMIAGKRLVNDWNVLRNQALLFRWFRNWREIGVAERAGRILPPLILRNGLQVHHGEGDSPLYIFNEIFVEQCYTKSNFYKPRPQDVVLDIGANIGIFALYMQWLAPGIRVHCFEPAAETRSRLEHNIKANGLEKQILIYPFAVSDRPGLARLKQGRKTGVRSFFEHEDSEGGEDEVQCISLSQAMERCGVDTVDLLKVDVEGAEIEVFEGTDAASFSRIQRVALEFHDLFRPGCRDRVKQVLNANGFNGLEVDYSPAMRNRGVIRARR